MCWGSLEQRWRACCLSKLLSSLIQRYSMLTYQCFRVLLMMALSLLDHLFQGLVLGGQLQQTNLLFRDDLLLP